MLQRIPRVVEVRRVGRTFDLRLGEEQQVRFFSLKMVVDGIEITVQTSNISEVHF